jgi:hypothetical protein
MNSQKEEGPGNIYNTAVVYTIYHFILEFACFSVQDVMSILDKTEM